MLSGTEVPTAALKDKPGDLAKEMDAMHKAQNKILEAGQKNAATTVKNTLDNANEMHTKLSAELEKEAKGM